MKLGWLMRLEMGLGFLFALGVADGHTKATEEILELGRKVYNFRCYYCHGYSGNAKTLAATFLDPPPRDFTRAVELSQSDIRTVVEEGKRGTGMVSFASVLSPEEMDAVSAFVHEEFITRQAVNLRYHDPANGWEEVNQDNPARPFALGELALDTPDDQLTAPQRQGKALFLTTCISCHDRSRVKEEGLVWEEQAVSYPRLHYSHRNPDALTGATPYAVHDVKPVIANLTPEEQKGETLFQQNCAFCHGADGTGKNWIGTFLEPHPRNLTDPAFMSHLTEGQLKHTIRVGIPETSMPAWGSVLSEADIQAVVRYIGKAFHPLGKDASPQ
ncbi:MAG: cytochrome c [Magnetococcales bacterium]|nr:cytochrome c [Magnetococcales bacterium]NGZ26724.1 cytochrome c [Magnetococcales bacterium]